MTQRGLIWSGVLAVVGRTPGSKGLLDNYATNLAFKKGQVQGKTDKRKKGDLYYSLKTQQELAKCFYFRCCSSLEPLPPPSFLGSNLVLEGTLVQWLG